jgi:Trypsin-like peptidase domain
MSVIDQYSVAAIPIEMFFNQTWLALATGFVWAQDGEPFLITNWHNVSGKDPNTGRHVSREAAEPNKLKIWFNQKDNLGSKSPKLVSIRDSHDAPLWFVHPRYGSKVDIVALPLQDFPDVEMYAINTLAEKDLAVQIGFDVFILGFPFGIGPGGFPIWKRGSIASEPELVPTTQLHVFVDTASRPGMSGSPVVRRSWNTHMLADGSVLVEPSTATKFVGVYSGRTATKDALDAQLGFTWPASFVPEIVSGRRVAPEAQAI